MRIRFPHLYCVLTGLVLFVTTDSKSDLVSTNSVIASKLQHFVTEQAMAGAVVLVANKDRILDFGAVGYSDLTTRQPMRTDNLFWIASMTKSFTSVALMMLVDQGKVELDDSVETYIPEFNKLKIIETNGVLVALNRPVTIREILSHT